MFLNQGAQGFGGFAVEINFRQGHEVFQTSAETFGEIQPQEFSGGEFQRRGKGDLLSGRLLQRVGAHGLPRPFRGIGSLHLDGACQILIGVGMVGFGGEHNAVDGGGSVVRKADMMRVQTMPSAAPLGMPIGGMIAVEDEFGQTVLSTLLSHGLLRTVRRDFPLRLGHFDVGVAECSAHALNILRLNGGKHVALHQIGEHAVCRQVVGVLLVGKVHPSVVILGLDVAAGLHENGRFPFEFHGGLVAVVTRPLIVSSVGVTEVKFIAVVPLAALHRASEGATIVGEVGHDTLAGASAREFFEEGIEAAEPGGDNGVLEARTVFENDLFGSHVEEEACPLAGFPIGAVHEDVHTGAFTPEALGDCIAAGAVDGYHATALVICECLVFIRITVIPGGKNDGAIVFSTV